MKYIKPYQIFESEPIRTVFTKEQLNWLDKCVKGSWKYNPQTGLVDVDGDFDCSDQNLQDFKGVKFGDVSGNFLCYYNQFTTLEGAPQAVGGDFIYRDNQLTSLVGAPQAVGGDFICFENQLTSLKGAPKTVGRNFDGSHNPVSGKTLKGIFALMKNGKSYQQALEERWPEMGDEDRVLTYKDHPSLSPEDVRKYKALFTYGNIKDYL
jgi:hypothetical protein